MTSLELGLALGLPFLGVMGGIVKYFDSRLGKKRDKEDCEPHIKAVDEVKEDIKELRTQSAKNGQCLARMEGMLNGWAKRNRAEDRPTK